MSKHTSQAVFYPKIITVLKDYSWSQFNHDLVAGIIVGVVALPLAIAFAITSGVSPERGLSTAIVAGFLISALGGSRVQIGGPTGAFVVIVSGITAKYGIDGLLICTFLAGGMLVAMGFLRLGTIIKFIPYPLVVGFTSGIAVIIFSSQIGDLFGLKTGPLPGDFLHQWGGYAKSFGTIDTKTTLISLGAILIMQAWPRINRKIPASLIAIILVTAVTQYLRFPVETVGARFGAISLGLPVLRLPAIDWQDIKTLIQPAFTVALLGAIESLLSATVADGMIEGRHRSNTELVAQGIANLAVPLFGGIPATGAIARTATNVKNGGRTPVAGMVHALTLLSIVLLFGRYAGMIPLCVLAVILIHVAYHMSEWHAFRALLRAPKMDVVVLLTTFGLTVLVDLAVAVEIGLLLSMVLFLKRMTEVTSVREITQELERSGEEEETMHEVEAVAGNLGLPKGVVVYEAEGAFFFGVAEMFRDTMNFGTQPPKVLILRIRHVLALDATGLRALADLHKKCVGMGTHLILEGVHAQPFIALDSAGFLDELGRQNVCDTLEGALARSKSLLHAQ